MAHAEALDDGRLAERYEFMPDWADCTVPGPHRRGPTRGLPVLELHLVARVERRALGRGQGRRTRGSVTIHGGPEHARSTRATSRRTSHDNPQVDIAVHGEGEATFAELLDALDGVLGGDGPPDLSVLARRRRASPSATATEIVRTADRDRIADLDIIPSPYLTGLFDVDRRRRDRAA